MEITGSILSNFSSLELSTADEKHYTLKNTPLTRLALRIIGVPHLGFRMRARTILGWSKGLSPGARVLDAGCGYGLYSMLLAEHGCVVDAIDIEQVRVDALTRILPEYPAIQKNITVRQGSLTALPFEDATYDAIICSEVIEHIAEDTKALAELARVLKPTGTLFLSVPMDSAMNKKIFRTFGHERPGYSNTMLEAHCRNIGLTITNTITYQHAFGDAVFNFYNRFTAKAMLGILFYPCYALMLLDQALAIGEPNYIIVSARRV